MRYHAVEKARFLARPNRFIAHVDLEGRTEVCHVKNTGRCRELLLPGATVYLQESDNANRKTRYDLIGVEKGEMLVNIDSQIPNRAVAEWLRGSQLFPEGACIQMEKKYGNSRLDLYVESGERKAYVEVKGVTLEVDGQARFPDAPTERGVKHVRELMGCVREGYEAYLIFVIQMAGMRELAPNWETHPEFGRALQEAQRAGVRILAYGCQVFPDEITIDAAVPVNLGG